MLLTDTTRDVVYLPFPSKLVSELKEWSAPVQVRLRPTGAGELELELRPLPVFKGKLYAAP